MATRAFITAKMSNGSWRTVYLHGGGGALTLLNAHYTTQATVDTLMSGGDMSRIGANPGTTEGHSFANPIPGFCVYYTRDRGEKMRGTQEFPSKEAAQKSAGDDGGELRFCWDGEKWADETIRD